MDSPLPERSDKKPLSFEEVYPLPRPMPNAAAGEASGERSDTSGDPADSGLRGDLTDIDLYCLHCGYNLRGLSGDPRRCPECGNLSSISEMTLPARTITAQLRRMESAPTVCVGLTLLMLVGLLTGLLVLAGLGLSAMAAVFGLGCLLMIALLMALWLWSVLRFRSACMGKPGWSEVLFEYHLHGMGICVVLIVSFALPWLFAMQQRGPRLSWPLVVSLAVLIAACAGVVVLAPRIRRRCKAKMDVLQREVAVKMAGEYLRKRLSRRHR